MSKENQDAFHVPVGLLVDLGFMDARSKLLDIAAFLDRIERHGGSDDFRVTALRRALAEVSSSTESGRARRVLELLSDTSQEPAAKASTKAACGAPPPASD